MKFRRYRALPGGWRHFCSEGTLMGLADPQMQNVTSILTIFWHVFQDCLALVQNVRFAKIKICLRQKCEISSLIRGV